MIDACLAARAHYLDITGEIAVFESAAARDADARSAGVMLLPGIGFDVVPSDCLALHVRENFADAHELTLGFFGLGSVSHGTATTIVENVHRGGFVRRDGKLMRAHRIARARHRLRAATITFLGSTRSVVTLFLFAHGAGAPSASRWMQAYTRRLEALR